MKFLNPSWLWGLALVPLFYGWVFLDEKRKTQKFSEFIRPSLWSRMVPQWNPQLRLNKAKYWLMGFIFALFALARPQWGSHEEWVQVAGLDVMLVLDVSNSMEVEDVVPSRLLKAKHMIRKLLDQLEGDRVGVIAFAGSSYVASPLTTDLNYIWEVTQTLGPKLIKNQGTHLSLGLETALRAMDRGAEDKSGAKAEGLESRVMILISDGEDHEGELEAITKKIQQAGVKLYVLGVGTEQGGPIPIKDENGNPQGFKRDRSGGAVVSSFHSKTLEEVAQGASGKYWNVTEKETELGELFSQMGALNRSNDSERRYLVFDERFQIPLLIAIVLFFIEISLPARKILAIFFVLMTLPKLALASEFQSPRAPLDAYLENEKGLKAYSEGKMEEAQKSFGAAQARDPSLPELEFNQGIVQLKKGELEQAIQSFSNAAMLSQDKGDGSDKTAKKNKSLMGKSLYNLGNAQVKKGDLSGAVRSYIGAIHAARETKDPVLEQEAKKNLQLLLSEKQKQQQKQEQEQKDQQQQKEDQQQQQKDQQQQQQKDQQQQAQKTESSSQEKVYKNTSQEKFKSKNMSQEDAERVMTELASKEQQLQIQEKVQEKFKAQHVKPQASPKDW